MPISVPATPIPKETQVSVFCFRDLVLAKEIARYELFKKSFNSKHALKAFS